MVAGTGTLSMPYAVAQSGWLGVVIVMLALFMSTTTGNMLIQCLYLNTDRRRSSFQQIARDAYGSMGHYIAVGAVGINLFGCAILYIILASTLIHGMVANPNDPSVPPSTFFIGCSLFVWVCLIFTKSMKEIAVLSLIGAGATVGVVMITVGVSAEMVIHRAVEAVAATHQFADWSKVPLSLATMSYAYGGNVVYPQVEQTMKHPRKWSTALWLALSTCFVMYISIAVAGYLAFGNLTMNPILENLPHGVWSTLANSLITLHVLLAAPILLASFAVMIEDSIAARAPAFEQGTKSQQFLKRATSRTIVILFAGLVASALPYFGDLMDLLGALATCLLVYVMPVLFYYRLGGMKNVFWLNQMWIWFIFVVGMVVIVVGTYDATKHLIEDIQHH
ncbi:hypothetical protein BX616_002154 [Lobosporangium transversale]|nr:hypothetical protein BX616_002154 [Lobosporangium transversale]